MINFAEIFNENYQYFLKDIDYKVLTAMPLSNDIGIDIKDTISYETKNGSEFELSINRKVGFVPDQLYELSVCFCASLNIINKEKMQNVNWDEEFRNNPVFANIIQGLLSRISLLISQITSSYGQNPLVTPPNII